MVDRDPRHETNPSSFPPIPGYESFRVDRVPEGVLGIEITPDLSHLSPPDQKAARLLARAVFLINSIYLEQLNQDSESTTFDGNAGNNFYPEGFTLEELEAYLNRFPENERQTIRQELMDPRTVVRRAEDGALESIPYSEYYQPQLAEIIELLETAADEVTDQNLGDFLRGRAQAFRDNKYRENDIEWVRMVTDTLEIIIGPFEKYADSTGGVKRDFEGVLGVVLREKTNALKEMERHAKEFDAYLGAELGYTPSDTSLPIPMIVVDQIMAGGDPQFQYPFSAVNLVNETDIQQTVGSKKIFMHNIYGAIFENLLKPTGAEILSPKDAARLDQDKYFNFVAGHELAHGFRFRFNGEHFGPLSTPLEETKADVFGQLFLFHLAENSLIESDIPVDVVISHVISGIRRIRDKREGAYGVASSIQLKCLYEAGALEVADGKFIFHEDKILPAFTELGVTLFNLTQTEDQKQAQAFLDSEAQLPEDIERIIEKVDRANIPSEVYPIFDPSLLK